MSSGKARCWSFLSFSSLFSFSFWEVFDSFSFSITGAGSLVVPLVGCVISRLSRVSIFMLLGVFLSLPVSSLDRDSRKSSLVVLVLSCLPSDSCALFIIFTSLISIPFLFLGFPFGTRLPVWDELPMGDPWRWLLVLDFLEHSWSSLKITFPQEISGHSSFIMLLGVFLSPSVPSLNRDSGRFSLVVLVLSFLPFDFCALFIMFASLISNSFLPLDSPSGTRLPVWDELPMGNSWRWLLVLDCLEHSCTSLRIIFPQEISGHSSRPAFWILHIWSIRRFSRIVRSTHSLTLGGRVATGYWAVGR